MKNGKDTIDYMQMMIHDLELIANEPKNFGKVVASELEDMSYDMFKSMRRLQELIYMYGDV